MFKDGKPHLIIGAPGATQIAMGVLQVILNVVDFGMTMVEAVSAPRFSATSDTIDISNRIQRGRVGARAAGAGLSGRPPAPTASASRPSMASASMRTVSMAAPISRDGVIGV